MSWFIFADSPEFSESVSYESAGAVSPEFLKKLEEWEKVKALKGKLCNGMSNISSLLLEKKQLQHQQ